MDLQGTAVFLKSIDVTFKINLTEWEIIFQKFNVTCSNTYFLRGETLLEKRSLVLPTLPTEKYLLAILHKLLL